MGKRQTQIFLAIEHFCATLTFLSRLPSCRTGRFTTADALRVAPLAGLVIACVPAVVLFAGSVVRLPSLATAALALAAQVWATGALHEDGLADVADGFGGGSNREAKLAIMRDSRIGTFGAAALCFGLLLRVACLAHILERSGPGLAAPALLIAASLSRAAMLVPLSALPPARPDGLAQSLGTMARATLWSALMLAAAAAAGLGWGAGLTMLRIGGSLLAALASCLILTALARGQIGGVTGDVVGGCQQVAEIAVLLVLAADGLA